jgi:Protein of unknown function (DUF1549)/Protein of unknown function (DUF1553)
MKPYHSAIIWCLVATTAAAFDDSNSADLARRVDQIIFGEQVVDDCDDATFLRRISFDIAGRPATPAEITRFGLDPSPDKRERAVDALLADDEYAENWARYWRDAIFRRATNVRSGLVRSAFEEWLAAELAQNTGWNSIVTDLVTATGPVNNNGETALIFAHEGVPEEVAAEASRLFLGIQIQCANCHDHPWDSWKREQFHQLVAFFPRVSVRRDRDSDKMSDYEIASVDVDRSRNRGLSNFYLTRLDRNRDRYISQQEAKGSPLERLYNRAKDVIDRNSDGKVSIEEILTAEPPNANRAGRGSTEHYMPDLSDPGSKGTQIDPAFFVTGQPTRTELTDAARRTALSNFITSTDNEWFSKAIVNRMWFEMTGTAFYMPIDDIGPDRSAEHEEALNALCDGFVRNGHDLKWLIKTIASTAAYQRAPDNSSEGFARSEPARLRSDQLYTALCQALGVSGIPIRSAPGRGNGGGYRRRGKDPARDEFSRVFGFDPSTPRDELTGTIPEALFMMNSGVISRLITDRSADSLITRIGTQVLTEEDMILELYLNAVGREPMENELATAMEHVQTADSIREGLEDVLWALVNSPEFSSRR